MSDEAKVRQLMLLRSKESHLDQIIAALRAAYATFNRGDLDRLRHLIPILNG
jgi:hypothetical protein